MSCAPKRANENGNFSVKSKMTPKSTGIFFGLKLAAFSQRRVQVPLTFALCVPLGLAVAKQVNVGVRIHVFTNLFVFCPDEVVWK
jgi:hypothetical protein